MFPFLKREKKAEPTKGLTVGDVMAMPRRDRRRFKKATGTSIPGSTRPIRRPSGRVSAARAIVQAYE